ncbi:hypothetical protein C8R45DRAFT_1147366 [Mycena sanguinolenta]|nr:hypothetical protein C8R45DRAFT_1147366 [Mycena sanguinolenta]
MASARSLDASTSQPSPKGGETQQKLVKSRSSKHGESMSQTVVNHYISGGHGGAGGQGGVHRGGGGSGEGPTLHYEINGENITMNMVQSPNVVQTSSQVVNHCPPASRNFHGRRTILDAMHAFFAQDTQKQKIYVLYGLGGAGKTQIALRFIEESPCFTDQLLLDASTTDTMHTGLRNMATAKNAGTTSQDALAWLVGRHENWLLFFDNADDPNISLNQFSPRCNHGNIIITSRNPNLRVYGGNSHVTDMEESDAVVLLLKSSQQEVSASNQLLAQDIVNVSYQLYIDACWVTVHRHYGISPWQLFKRGHSFQKLELLEHTLNFFLKNRTELLKKKASQQHDDCSWAVYTTWEMSFKKLTPVAAMFLQLCSFIYWDDISEDIFSRAANRVMQLPEQPLAKTKRLDRLKSKFKRLVFLSIQSRPSSDRIPISRNFLSHFVGATGQWDSLAFLNVTNEIRAYSLLNFNPERKTFSIHPLVHSWTRTTLDEAESYHWCMDDILGISIWEIPEHDMPLACLRLVSHVDALVKDFPTKFGSWYAEIYRHAGRYADARELQIIEVQNQRKLYGSDGLDTLHAMNKLAITYGRLGQFEEAEKLKLEVLEKRRRLLVTYHNLEQFEEAAKLYIVVVKKWKQFAGDDHPRTLGAMHDLAITYDALGRFEEAEKLKVVVLQKRKKIFGEDHLETLHSIDNLGYTYHCLGKLVEAEALLVVVLEKRRELLGDDHLETQHTMQNLINTYHGRGNKQRLQSWKCSWTMKWKMRMGTKLGQILGFKYSCIQITSRLLKLTNANVRDSAELPGPKKTLPCLCGGNEQPWKSCHAAVALNFAPKV